jgi:hypothetical protein
MSVDAYPLHWPAGHDRTPAHKRERSRFGHWNKPISVAKGTAAIIEQVKMFTRMGHRRRINWDTLIISTDLKLRNDGLPRSSQRTPDDPGVAVYFELDGHPYAMPCDKWDRIGDNLWAIAKHLEAMRGMERWGVGSLKTAFAGFNALPPGTGAAPTAFTPDAAARFLAGEVKTSDTIEQVINDIKVYKSLYRRVAAALHPDRGGDHDRFKLLQEAKRVLDKHFEGKR